MLRRTIFYPFLLASFPSLALWAYNADQLTSRAVLRPWLISLLLACLAVGVCYAFTRNWRRAGLAAALLLVWFFTYGHIYMLVKDSALAAAGLARHRYLFPLYSLCFGALGWLALRRVKNHPITLWLNSIALVLLAAPLFQLAQHAFLSGRSAASPETSGQVEVGSVDLTRAPDVYYIILDGYAREDVLREEFEFDNRPFLDELRAMGFTVADCSRSNYPSTKYSLASSLNMDYLQNLGEEFASGSKDRYTAVNLIKNSRVEQTFQAAGYQSAAFDIEYTWAVWSNADVLLHPTQTAQVFSSLSPFEEMLARTSVLAFVGDAQSQFLKKLVGEAAFPYRAHVDEVKFILAKLPALESLGGPKLVFAHILVPHMPFVFAPDGSILADENFYRDGNKPVDWAYYQRGYTSQVQFINRQILPILKKLIKNSKVPPVIILQGDHGPDVDNHAAILNAYYLPGVSADRLHPDISPVNTFRLVLDAYFGTQLGLLEDRSYTSPLDRIDFTPVLESSPTCASGSTNP